LGVIGNCPMPLRGLVPAEILSEGDRRQDRMVAEAFPPRSVGPGHFLTEEQPSVLREAFAEGYAG